MISVRNVVKRFVVILAVGLVTLLLPYFVYHRIGIRKNAGEPREYVYRKVGVTSMGARARLSSTRFIHV